MYVSTLQPLIHASTKHDAGNQEQASDITYVSCSRTARQLVMECMFATIRSNNQMIYLYCSNASDPIFWGQVRDFLTVVKSNEIIAGTFDAIFMLDGYEPYTAEHVRHLRDQLEESTAPDEPAEREQKERMLLNAKMAMKKESLVTKTLLRELELEYRYPEENRDKIKKNAAELKDSIGMVAMLGIILADYTGTSIQRAEIRAKKDLQKLLDFAAIPS